jgi:hypothetical protein
LEDFGAIVERKPWPTCQLLDPVVGLLLRTYRSKPPETSVEEDCRECPLDEEGVVDEVDEAAIAPPVRKTPLLKKPEMFIP